MSFITTSILIAELSIVITFYFSMYNPLKKKEISLDDNKKITIIKKYLLKSSIMEIKQLLSIMLISFLISGFSVFLRFYGLLINFSSFLFFICIVSYIVSAVRLFISYIKYHRNKEAICDSKKIEQILKIINIKKDYVKDIKKIFEITFNRKEKDDKFGEWFIDALENFSDKRITEK